MKKRASSSTSRSLRVGGINVPSKVLKGWVIDKQNILNSFHVLTGETVFKFSFQPESEELLFSPQPDTHAMMISSYGKMKFERYVRGIFFKEKRIVYLREHVNKSWLEYTEKYLREHGVPQHIRVIWGKVAAIKLANELRGL